jgi:hypothetical protein
VTDAERSMGAQQPPASERRIAVLLGTGLLAYYLLILGGHHYSVDGIVTFEVARSLLFEGSLIFDPPLRWWGADYQFGHWGVGQSLGYLAVLLASYPLFVIVPGLKAVPHDPRLFANPELHTNIPYLIASALNPVLTAATSVVVFQIARTLSFSRRHAAAVALAYGFATPAATYSRYDVSQPHAALALTIVMLLLLRSAGMPSSESRHRTFFRLIAAGVVLGLLVLTRIELLVVLPVLMLWILVKSGRHPSERFAGALLFAVPVGAAFQTYRWIEAVKYPDVGRFASAAAFNAQLEQWFRFSPTALLEGLSGLLISPGRGLLIFFPLLVLAIPGFFMPALRRSGGSSLMAGLLIVPLALYSAFAMWWAGVTWGPRFLVPFLPMLTIAAGAFVFLHEGPGVIRRRRLFLSLCALGAVISWNGVLLDPTEFYIRQAARFHPDAADTQFQWLASPLVSGWAELAARPPDMLWIQLLRPSDSECVVRLAASFARWTSVDLVRYGPIVGSAMSATLVTCMAVTGAQLRKALSIVPRTAPSDGRRF